VDEACEAIVAQQLRRPPAEVRLLNESGERLLKPRATTR